MRWPRILGRLLLVLGLLMLGVYVGAGIHRLLLSRVALEEFKAKELGPKQETRVALSVAKPNFSLWSDKRVRDYEQTLSMEFSPAVGILRIPKIQLEVPVLEGTDEFNLNRGVGRIEGTSYPGEQGNVGIAGHRDGFFRGLKDIGVGDTIELVTPGYAQTYVVDNVVVVDPSDVSVLKPRLRPALTLVTCYPFYFAGSAPKRYIVQATIQTSYPAKQTAHEQWTVEAKSSQLH